MTSKEKLTELGSFNLKNRKLRGISPKSTPDSKGEVKKVEPEDGARLGDAL